MERRLVSTPQLSCETDEDGNNLLHYATAEGAKDTVVIMLFNLRLYSLINSRNSFQHTPLHFAVMFGSLALVKLLIDNKATVNFKDET